MILGGLWHGARYNFLLWGIYQGLLLAIHRFTSKNIEHKKDHSSPLLHWMKVLGMFQLTLFGWLLFRVESMEQLELMLVNLFFQWNSIGVAIEILAYAIPVIIPLINMQVWQYRIDNLEPINNLKWPYKTAFVAFCIAAVIFLNRSDGTPLYLFSVLRFDYDK